MIRVLIADDHSGIRFSLVRFLKHQPDMTVVGQAENGAQTLELVKELQPDILILDIIMSDMTGIDVAKKLRRKKISPKIIIFSNYYDPVMIDNLLKIGVLGYIAKEDGSIYLPEAIRQVNEGKLWLGPTVQQQQKALVH